MMDRTPRRQPERQASPALTACMAALSEDVVKLATRLMGDAMTLTRIAGALSVGDRLVLGRMERYAKNGQAGADRMRDMVNALREAAKSGDAEFGAKHEGRRKAALEKHRRREERDAEALRIGRRALAACDGVSLLDLGQQLRRSMAILAFPKLAPPAACTAWDHRYHGKSAQDIVSEFMRLCIRRHVEYGLPEPDEDENPARLRPVERDGNVIHLATRRVSHPELSA